MYFGTNIFACNCWRLRRRLERVESQSRHPFAGKQQRSGCWLGSGGFLKTASVQYTCLIQERKFKACLSRPCQSDHLQLPPPVRRLHLRGEGGLDRNVQMPGLCLRLSRRHQHDQSQPTSHISSPKRSSHPLDLTSPCPGSKTAILDPAIFASLPWPFNERRAPFFPGAHFLVGGRRWRKFLGKKELIENRDCA